MSPLISTNLGLEAKVINLFLNSPSNLSANNKAKEVATLLALTSSPSNIDPDPSLTTIVLDEISLLSKDFQIVSKDAKSSFAFS